MTSVKILSTFLILLSINCKINSQHTIILSHYNQFDNKKNKVSYKSHTSKNNEVEQVVSVLFIFYKKFISSQDYNSCVFEPSCSVYSIESVKKLGVLRGYMNTFDRMSRCHGLASEYYPIDPKTSLLYDPVK
jgi:putative membrane protein insertion efficiency factor